MDIEEKKYFREYYKKNRHRILERYFNTKKKTPKCKKCGKILPKEIHGATRYCDNCLYSKGTGAEAHLLAAARYARKKHLTNKKKRAIIW